MTPRLYLDNAATSFPKPPGVYEAMLRYGTTIGASPGRGHYAESREGARLIRQCRERICTLIHGEAPTHVVFTLNTTDALNLAIKGVVRAARRQRGPSAPLRIVTTAMDHNSVLRPLHALRDDGVEVVSADADPATGMVDPASVVRLIDAHTVLAAANMVSNVTGTIQPTAAIGEACRSRGVPFLADAAQALGHIPVDVQAMNIDLLAFPGHKGLLGPQGTGGLYVRPGILDRVATTREGGTGSWSESDAQPLTMPERMEAGSHNTIGIVGLGEAVGWVLGRGVASLRGHEEGLIDAMLDGLRAGGCRSPLWANTPGPLGALALHGPVQTDQRVGVFGLRHDTLDPAEVAAILEARFGILARSGLTCAPGAHRTFGTLASGGTFRVSIGPFVTPADVARLLDALACIGRSELHPVVEQPAVTSTG